MAIIYYYILTKYVSKIKEGIMVDNYSNRILVVDGESKPCIIGLLSPKDDIIKHLSDDFTCLELEIDVNHCFVLDGDLNILEDKKEYYNSAIRLSNYFFGKYRSPEIAVLCDIPSQSISFYKKIIGAPIIFDTSDILYKSNLFEDLRQRYDDFDETMLGIFFMLMTHKGRYKLIGKETINTKTVYIYQDNTTKKIYTINVQEGLKNK